MKEENPGRVAGEREKSYLRLQELFATGKLVALKQPFPTLQSSRHCTF